jgi:hypothetical protein
VHLTAELWAAFLRGRPLDQLACSELIWQLVLRETNSLRTSRNDHVLLRMPLLLLIFVVLLRFSATLLVTLVRSFR